MKSYKSIFKQLVPSHVSQTFPLEESQRISKPAKKHSLSKAEPTVWRKLILGTFIFNIILLLST